MTPNLIVVGRAVDEFELCIFEAIVIKGNRPMITAPVNDFNHTSKIFC